MKVTVGSTNPVKIAAVRLAFAMVWPEQEWEVQGVKTASAIADQPMSDEESITGARNRARGALAQLDAAYGVGLEGGLQQIGDWWFDAGWAVVINKQGQEGIGSTIKVALPERAMQMIQDGMELGDVSDVLFQKEHSKQVNGYFGLMTNNVITRDKAYADGVIAALVRFIHPGLFAAHHNTQA